MVDLNRYLHHLLLALLLISCTESAMSQGDDLIKIAMEDHDVKKNQLFWIRDMTGYLDGMHRVRMVLVTDNKEFHGCYQLLSSGVIFKLDGEFIGDEIVLNEYNENGNISGIITGEMSDNAFYAEWSDYKNLERLPMILFTEPDYTSPCGDLGWIKYFSGNQKVNRIKLKKIDQDKEISFFVNDSLYILKLECEDDNCLELFSEKLDDNDDLTVRVKQSGTIVHFLIKSDKINESFIAAADKTMNLDCISYADYCHRSDVIVPVGNSGKFEKWVKSMLTPYERKCGKDIVIVNPDGISVVDRFTNTAHGTIKVDLFRNAIFSGLFIFQSSDDPFLVEQPYIFDLKRNKAIRLSDLFISESEVLNRIRELSDKQKMMEFKEPDKSWFKTVPFDLVTLGENGFVCRNRFNTIYGQESIVLPYQLFKSYLKPKSKYSLY